VKTLDAKAPDVTEAPAYASATVVCLCPTPADAAVMRRLFASAELNARVFEAPAPFIAALNEAVDVLLIAEEAIDGPAGPHIRQRLTAQEDWSAMPLIILSNASSWARRAAGLDHAMLRRVTLLERPVRLASLLGVVRMALAERAQQYRVRDLLAERAGDIARRDEFLATLAHELRNPLAPIRTGLDLIQALRGDAAACEEPLQIMERQFDHLVHLVDDLLDVSRISRGKIELRKERLDLAEIIHAALEMSEGGLHAGDRQVSVNVPSEPLVVEGDRVRLVQVIANLLNNAAKFTDADGRIDVRVMHRGERVEIWVQDDGRGIAHERLDKIFEMFSQAEPGLGGGLGIGLSLVRRLVEMHGGTVGAASEGPGYGAIFTVSLPLWRSAPAHSTAEKAAVLGVLSTQCRVLVVDDNRDITKSLDLVLTMLGAEVRVAHDGAEAICIFDDWPPTHVLMDLGMPGMDGYEAARRLRAKPADHAFRLVAMTGWGQEEDRQQVREAGFDEHLVKPVGVEELKAVLSSEPAGAALAQSGSPQTLR